MTQQDRKAAAAVERLRARLTKLSRNLWWSWNTEANELWDRVVGFLPAGASPERRATLRANPVALLSALGARPWAKMAADAELKACLREVEAAFRAYKKAPTPPFDLAKNAPVAYFSMEFGLHESLPIYSGGLGILAGDHIKSASDTGVPLVGVTFFYRRGYFRQRIDAKGEHDVSYLPNDPDQLPLEPVVDRSGRKVRVKVELPGRDVWMCAWRCDVGRRALYLLDTDVPQNARADRAISHRLYDGDRETRITQEIVLGIGGVRLLRALGIAPGVWHLNEGHVAFLTVERLRELSESTSLTTDEALEAISADTVFTTHTPVPAGNETFDIVLAERYLRSHCEAAGIPVEDYLRLGLDWDDDGRPQLSLTVLAIRLSRFRNGVSALHGDVSRDMWSKLWPDFAAQESPITSVTNGIHVPTWVAPQLDRLYRRYLGDDWQEQSGDAGTWKKARRIPAAAIWKTKRALKEELIAFVRERTAQRLRRYGYSEARVVRATENLLDPDALTIGFARRFATYKRASLLFRDLKKARQLFSSKKRPVQIIFAGKPHPADPEGRALLEGIEAVSRRAGFKGKVVVIENYDTEVCRHMVRGVDVWLNNPRRPQEASGTSGQKVPVNCGLNLSILDGWWCEGCAPDVGWAFGKAKDYVDLDQQDRDDHADLLRVLQRQVLPTYYDRNARGISQRWVSMLKASLAKLVYRFSTRHMVLDYAENLYAPALGNGRVVREGRYADARELADWGDEVARSWPLVHARGITRRKRGADVEVEVYLGAISPDTIACCDTSGDLLEIHSARRVKSGGTVLRIEAPAGESLRIFPAHPSQVHPQELGLGIVVDV